MRKQTIETKEKGRVMKTVELTKAQWLRLLFLQEKGFLKLTDTEVNSIYWSGKVPPNVQQKFNKAHKEAIRNELNAAITKAEWGARP